MGYGVYFKNLILKDMTDSELNAEFTPECAKLSKSQSNYLIEKYGADGVTERFRAICAEHAAGGHMVPLHKKYGICHATFGRISTFNRSLRDLYRDCCNMYCDHLFDESIQIIDDTSHDTIIDEKRGAIENSEWIRRSIARCDVRKSYALRYNSRVRLRRSTDDLAKATRDLANAVLDGDMDVGMGKAVMEVLSAQQKYITDNELLKRVEELERAQGIRAKK